jgi:hypothetical protein
MPLAGGIADNMGRNLPQTSDPAAKPMVENSICRIMFIKTIGTPADEFFAKNGSRRGFAGET